MLSKELEQAINEQINNEFWSAYLYLSMSMHFNSQGLAGFAHWFYIQFDEEQGHAKKMMDYLIERGSKVELKPIAAVPTYWESPVKAFEDTLTHETEVTLNIHKLVKQAREENDYATENLMMTFVNEQVEEEANAKAIVEELRWLGDDKAGVFALNEKLGTRQ